MHLFGTEEQWFHGSCGTIVQTWIAMFDLINAFCRAEVAMQSKLTMTSKRRNILHVDSTSTVKDQGDE